MAYDQSARTFSRRRPMRFLDWLKNEAGSFGPNLGLGLKPMGGDAAGGGTPEALTDGGISAVTLEDGAISAATLEDRS